MSTTFNPYHKWLGIPPDTKTIDYYRLLGIPRFEHDVEVIRAAADQRAAHLAKCMSGEHGELAKKLRSKILTAAACLLDPKKRSDYDAHIREGQSVAPAGEKAGAVAPVNKAKAAGGAVDVASFIGDGSSAKRHIPRKKPKSSPWIPWAILGGAAAAIGAVFVAFALQRPSNDRPIAAADAKPTTQPDDSTRTNAKPSIAAPIAMQGKATTPAADSPSVAKKESRPSPIAFSPVPNSQDPPEPKPPRPGPKLSRKVPVVPSVAEPTPAPVAAKPVRVYPVPPDTRDAGVSPQEFLAKYGLLKYGRDWVLKFEKTLREEGPKLVKLKTEYTKALDKVTAARRALRQADSALQQAKEEEHNLFGGGGFIDGNRIRGVQQQLRDAEAKRSAADEAANNAWSDAEVLTKSIDEKIKVLQADYDDAKLQYTSLVDAPAIRQAVKDFNADLDKPTSLGPTASFRDKEAQLKAIADIVGSTRTRIPYKLVGNLRYVSVELNGKKTVDMAVDTGAEIVSLSWKAAIDAGLDPSKGKRIGMGDASGGVSMCYKVVIPHVRVGKFVADDVECVVSPDHGGRDIPLLLGQSFLGRFNYQFDTGEQVIILSDATQARH